MTQVFTVLASSVRHATPGEFGHMPQDRERFLMMRSSRARRLQAVKSSRMSVSSMGATPSQFNDFGPTPASMINADGEHSNMFIHTTPADERDGQAGTPLTQSHGCIHISPEARQEMLEMGFLQKGVSVEVRGYGDMPEQGPPGPLEASGGQD